MVQAQYKAEIDKAQAEAAQAGPLAQAQATMGVLAAQTELAHRQAELRQRQLVAEVIKPAEAEAQARATIAAQQAAHPEVPITDDEKATVKSDNDAAIAAVKTDIAECQLQSAQMGAESQQLKISAEQMNKDIPEGNLDLMRKYADRYHDQLTSAFSAGSTTQPAHP